QSSNPAVLTIANNGLACAGTWDSLTNPLVCTAGATGTADVTAVAEGVTSPPVTVYVHQHITSIVIQKAPNQSPTLSTLCYTRANPSLGPGPESVVYEAFAFSGTADITSSVGPFTWQPVAISGQVGNMITLAGPPPGAPLHQETATAGTPGSTLIFASASGVNSQPVRFTTCPVQSISISALGNPSTSFVVNSGTSTTLNATVTDILGMTLTGATSPAGGSIPGLNLTWSSSN